MCSTSKTIISTKLWNSLGCVCYEHRFFWLYHSSNWILCSFLKSNDQLVSMRIRPNFLCCLVVICHSYNWAFRIGILSGLSEERVLVIPSFNWIHVGSEHFQRFENKEPRALLAYFSIHQIFNIVLVESKVNRLSRAYNTKLRLLEFE